MASAEWLAAASAIEDNDLKCLRELLGAHPELAKEAAFAENGSTLCIFAVVCGNLEALKELVDVSDLDQADEDGDTPAMLACARNRMDQERQVLFLKEVLRGDPDLTKRNCRGKTALSYAIHSGCLTAAKMIIAEREKKGEKVDGLSPVDVDDSGENLAHIAASGRGDGVECLDLVLSLGGGKQMSEQRSGRGLLPEEHSQERNTPSRKAYWKSLRERAELSAQLQQFSEPPANGPRRI